MDACDNVAQAKTWPRMSVSGQASQRHCGSLNGLACRGIFKKKGELDAASSLRTVESCFVDLSLQGTDSLEHTTGSTDRDRANLKCPMTAGATRDISTRHLNSTSTRAALETRASRRVLTLLEYHPHRF